MRPNSRGGFRPPRSHVSTLCGMRVEPLERVSTENWEELPQFWQTLPVETDRIRPLRQNVNQGVAAVDSS